MSESCCGTMPTESCCDEPVTTPNPNAACNKLASLSEWIRQSFPDSRSRSVLLTKLDECRAWAREML